VSRSIWCQYQCSINALNIASELTLRLSGSSSTLSDWGNLVDNSREEDTIRESRHHRQYPNFSRSTLVYIVYISQTFSKQWQRHLATTRLPTHYDQLSQCDDDITQISQITKVVNSFVYFSVVTHVYQQLRQLESCGILITMSTFHVYLLYRLMFVLQLEIMCCCILLWYVCISRLLWDFHNPHTVQPVRIT